MTTVKKHPLQGQRYVVKKEFESGAATFVVGEVLAFMQGGFSRYDDCYLYEFHDNLGAIKVWCLSAGVSEEDWLEFFDEC